MTIRPFRKCYTFAMEAYSLNQQILPGQPLSQKDHKKTISLFVIVIAIAAALSLWYLWIMSNRPAAAPIKPETDLNAQVAELLKQAPVHASQAEIDQVTTLLSKSKTAPSTAEQNTVANLLKK